MISIKAQEQIEVYVTQDYKVAIKQYSWECDMDVVIYITHENVNSFCDDLRAIGFSAQEDEMLKE